MSKFRYLNLFCSKPAKKVVGDLVLSNNLSLTLTNKLTIKSETGFRFLCMQEDLVAETTKISDVEQMYVASCIRQRVHLINAVAQSWPDEFSDRRIKDA